MSTCISSRGEYGSHELDDAYTCTWCGVLDEESLIAELRQLREQHAAAIDEGRHQAATAILAHADKHAPKDGNEAQRRLRRHLEIAARVAASPITMAQLAEALTEHFGGQP